MLFDDFSYYADDDAYGVADMTSVFDDAGSFADATQNSFYDMDFGFSDPVVYDNGGMPSSYYPDIDTGGNWWDVPLNFGVDAASVDSATATDGTAQQLFPDGGSVMYDLHGGIFQQMPDGTTINYAPTGTPLITTPAGVQYNDVKTYEQETGQSVQPPSGSPLTGILATINAVSQTALGVVNAWKNVGQPPPRVAQVTTQASGAVSTPTKQGTIVTRLPNGQTTVARMPVGTPYVFSDGSTVVNNGDGTLTHIDANGTTSKSSIGQTSAPVSKGSNIGVLAAMGLGMMLLSEAD